MKDLKTACLGASSLRWRWRGKGSKSTHPPVHWAQQRGFLKFLMPWLLFQPGRLLFHSVWWSNVTINLLLTPSCLVQGGKMAYRAPSMSLWHVCWASVSHANSRQQWNVLPHAQSRQNLEAYQSVCFWLLWFICRFIFMPLGLDMYFTVFQESQGYKISWVTYFWSQETVNL